MAEKPTNLQAVAQLRIVTGPPPCFFREPDGTCVARREAQLLLDQSQGLPQSRRKHWLIMANTEPSKANGGMCTVPNPADQQDCSHFESTP